jgi:hypothetical protein
LTVKNTNTLGDEASEDDSNVSMLNDAASPALSEHSIENSEEERENMLNMLDPSPESNSGDLEEEVNDVEASVASDDVESIVDSMIENEEKSKKENCETLDQARLDWVDSQEKENEAQVVSEKNPEKVEKKKSSSRVQKRKERAEPVQINFTGLLVIIKNLQLAVNQKKIKNWNIL